MHPDLKQTLQVVYLESFFIYNLCLGGYVFEVFVYLFVSLIVNKISQRVCKMYIKLSGNVGHCTWKTY